MPPTRNHTGSGARSTADASLGSDPRPESGVTTTLAIVTRVRLQFASHDPIEFHLEDVVDHGPPVYGFRAWLGAVFASTEGRWTIRIGEDELLGFRREELKAARVTEDGAELTLRSGDLERVLPVREDDVRAYGPEPQGVRAWLGRLAHGSGEAFVRLSDGRVLRFPMGGGPHVRFVEPASTPNAS